MPILVDYQGWVFNNVYGNQSGGYTSSRHINVLARTCSVPPTKWQLVWWMFQQKQQHCKSSLGGIKIIQWLKEQNRRHATTTRTLTWCVWNTLIKLFTKNWCNSKHYIILLITPYSFSFTKNLQPAFSVLVDATSWEVQCIRPKMKWSFDFNCLWASFRFCDGICYSIFLAYEKKCNRNVVNT